MRWLVAGAVALACFRWPIIYPFMLVGSLGLFVVLFVRAVRREL